MNELLGHDMQYDLIVLAQPHSNGNVPIARSSLKVLRFLLYCLHAVCRNWEATSGVGSLMNRGADTGRLKGCHCDV